MSWLDEKRNLVLDSKAITFLINQKDDIKFCLEKISRLTFWKLGKDCVQLVSFYPFPSSPFWVEYDKNWNRSRNKVLAKKKKSFVIVVIFIVFVKHFNRAQSPSVSLSHGNRTSVALLRLILIYFKTILSKVDFAVIFDFSDLVAVSVLIETRHCQ